MIDVKNFQRVVYEKNPLVEVISQVRFSEVLSLVDGQPSELQTDLAALYPVVDRFEGFELPTQILAGSNVPQNALKKLTQFSFSDLENEWTVNCSSNSFSLTSRKYIDFVGFEKRFTYAFGCFLKRHRPSVLNRIGIRYRNVIDFELLGPNADPAQELIAPPVRGILGNDLFDEKCFVHAQSNYEIDLDGMKVIFNSGLVRDQNLKKGYLIDADFIGIQQFGATIESAQAALGKFHEFSGPVFDAAITPRLRQLLKPQIS